jgi:hypothetical protein
MLFLALSKTDILLLTAGVLILQWILAVIALYFLFRDKGIKKNILKWNIFIMLGIIVGPLTYLIIRHHSKKESK